MLLRKFRNQKSPFAKQAFPCEILSQPKEPCCEIRVLLQNKPPFTKSFRSHKTPLRKFSQLRNHSQAHVFHFATSKAHFAAAKPPTKFPFCCEITFSLRNHLWAVKSPLGCEITFRLRNHLQAAKWPSPYEIDLRKRGRGRGGGVCENTLRSQGKLRKCQQSLATMHLKKRAPRTQRSHTRSLSLHF